MKTDETLWNKILAWMLCDSIPFQHWKQDVMFVCFVFPEASRDAPIFWCQSGSHYAAALGPCCWCSHLYCADVFAGCSSVPLQRWNKPKNSHFLKMFQYVSRFFISAAGMLRFFSWTEDPVLLESMPVPWLQNSDSRECHKVRIKPHVLQMCPAVLPPKSFAK